MKFFGSSSKDPLSDGWLYKVPIWRRTWFQICVLSLLVLGCASFIALAIFLKPLRDQADSYDLKDIYKLETASVITDRNGTEIGRIYVENRRPVNFDDVPFHFIQSLVATEDSRYFVHNGVDFLGIARAMVENLRQGSVVQGGSTITQQLARKSFGLSGRSYKRKIVEAFLAARIEEYLSKAEIMELYLNRIYFGSGFYGIEAAAMGYFGKSPAQLTIEESAALAGLIKSPNRLSPLRNPDQSIEARNQVFLRMKDEKMISPEDYAALVKKPLEPSPGASTSRSSYVYEQIRQRVIEEVGYEQAARGGFQIQTTIDQDIQVVAERSLLRNLSRMEKTPGYRHQTYAQYQELVDSLSEQEDADLPQPQYLQGAFLMIDNRTGAIIAMLGGRDYRHSEFNRAMQALRPSGTAFKPFVYATAFTKGMFPGTPVNDAPIDNRRVMIGGTAGILGEWGVETAENYHEGEITARRALARSKVAASVRLGLGLETGVDDVIATARKAGISSPMREYPSSFIGSSELLLDEFVRAYTIFPNIGSRPAKLYIVEAIIDNEGNTVYQADHAVLDEPVDVIDPISAFQVHSCLADVLTDGTGRKAHLDYGLKEFPSGGKTGTAYNFTDNWFVGYNSRVTCGVWAGFDQPRSIYRGAFSNDTVLPVWVDTMNASIEAFPPGPIDPPEGVVPLEICDRSGKRATDACYEAEVWDGRQLNVRCTRIEHVRPTRKIVDYCPLHGGERPDDQFGPTTTTLAFASPGSNFDFSGLQAVLMKSPTVLGRDPYNSMAPIVRPSLDFAEDFDDSDADGVVKPADVISPLDIGDEKFRVKLKPPPAIEFD